MQQPTVEAKSNKTIVATVDLIVHESARYVVAYLHAAERTNARRRQLHHDPTSRGLEKQEKYQLIAPFRLSSKDRLRECCLDLSHWGGRGRGDVNGDARLRSSRGRGLRGYREGMVGRQVKNKSKRRGEKEAHMVDIFRRATIRWLPSASSEIWGSTGLGQFPRQRPCEAGERARHLLLSFLLLFLQ